MSADTVDDLHCAEDLAGTLEAALRNLLDVLDGMPVRDDRYAPALQAAQAALVEAETYCRPSCCFLDEGECMSGDDEYCGSPCGHEISTDPYPEDE